MRPSFIIALGGIVAVLVGAAFVGGQAEGQGAGPGAAGPAPASDAAHAASSAGPGRPAGAASTSTARRLPGVLEPQMDARTALDLSITVPGDERVRVDEREKQVLGSREVPSGATTEVVVYTRDVLSGQVDRWQPVLRFSARSGPHEALLTDYPELTRRFANPLYADAGVAVADLAPVYRRLAADPRVASVSLLPIEAPVRPH